MERDRLVVAIDHPDIGMKLNWAYVKLSQDDLIEKAIEIVIGVWEWDDATMEKYLAKRVILHERALNGDVEPCTPKEMWATNDTFAVTAPGRKKAIKLFTKRANAEAYMVNNQFKHKGMYIDFRPGTRKRCELYCPVRDICPQNKAYKESLKQ